MTVAATHTFKGLSVTATHTPSSEGCVLQQGTLAVIDKRVYVVATDTHRIPCVAFMRVCVLRQHNISSSGGRINLHDGRYSSRAIASIISRRTNTELLSTEYQYPR